MKITPIVASRFRSDGGVMFGLVPKPIWSRLCAPDELNRIPQNANVLLLELPDGRRGLIDTGCGGADKFPEKALSLSGLGPGWPLMEALKTRNLAPEQIDFVILTHLHWDHAGGASRADGSPTFPNATLIVPAAEWADAQSLDPLLYKSYPRETIDPLGNYPDIDLREPGEIFAGVSFVHTGGHTRGHCAVLIEGKDLVIDHPDAPASTTRCLFLADACPSQYHLRMVFHPAYDLIPLETRAWKREWLPRCVEDHTWLFFCHDPEIAATTIVPDERKEFVPEQVLKAR